MQGGNALPSFIQYDNSTYTFAVYTLSNNEVGSYTIEVVISNGVKQFTATFTLTVVYFDYCTIQVVTPPTIKDIYYTVMDYEITVSYTNFTTD